MISAIWRSDVKHREVILERASLEQLERVSGSGIIEVVFPELRDVIRRATRVLMLSIVLTKESSVTESKSNRLNLYSVLFSKLLYHVASGVMLSVSIGLFSTSDLESDRRNPESCLTDSGSRLTDNNWTFRWSV